LIYLRQIFNLHPASPRTRDFFCAVTEEKFLPALPGSGGALVAAWFSHDEWYSQIEHLLAFESLEAFALFRERAASPGVLGEALGALGQLAFERREELVEDLRDSGSRSWPVGGFPGPVGDGGRFFTDSGLLDGCGREPGSGDRSVERGSRWRGLYPFQ
jgi:hypothetical protein